jgi:nitrogenase molybdenum-iron protein alpha/beta subunit
MGRTNRILPVYAGDVSGACSALFELGGMVVIHDPSGCNSTYNTHDETRWYDHNSLIFISGLVERDAILGNDDKFVNDVVDAAIELKPRFVALCNSPIPYITGTDFVAISKMIERRTGIPCFYVRTNGMHDYTVGAGNAFARIAEHFVDAQPRRNGTLNVLGMTPLDYCDAAVADDLHGFAQAAGFEGVSCWAMGSDLDEIRRAAQASINLVVSSTGLKAAHVLRERFGTPYVVGMPYAGFDAVIASALDSAAKTGDCSYPCRDARTPDATGDICVVGEPVAAGSCAAVLEKEHGPIRVVCPLEASPTLLSQADVRTDGEDEMEAALRNARLVVADALYAPVCPKGATLRPWPHLAFSGRSCFAQHEPIALQVSLTKAARDKGESHA